MRDTLAHGPRRSNPRKRSEFLGRPSELGALLADLRTAKGFSLREVEEATGKAVSNAYLSQLENGKIKKPSPNVLHSLAEVYVVPYEALMEKAGYLLPSEDGRRAPQEVGGLRDRRSDRRGGRRAPQVPGLPSLPQAVVMKRDHERILPPAERERK